MTIDPKTLQSFLAVCELHSFSQAARLRGLSQPTVTQHVQRLETAAGTTLFSRSSRGVELTSTGESLRRLAEHFEKSHQAILRLLNSERTLGRIRFGAAEDFAMTQLPTILRAFTSARPDVVFSLSVQEYLPLIDALKSEELDIVLVKQFDNHLMHAFEGQVVAADQLVWVSEPGFVLDPEEQVPLVTYRAPSLTRERVTGALADADLDWRLTCECQGTSGMSAAISAGFGIGALPLSLVPRGLTVCPPSFGLPELGTVNYVLLRRRDLRGDDATAVQALVDIIAQTALRIVQ